MLYVGWVSVDLNLTSRVLSGLSGFLAPQNRLPFGGYALAWEFGFPYYRPVNQIYFFFVFLAVLILKKKKHLIISEKSCFLPISISHSNNPKIYFPEQSNPGGKISSY